MITDFDEASINDFILEARELLDGVANDILQAEAEPENQELINAIFRGIHTFKGSAGTIGATVLVDFAHHLEGVLDALRNHRLSLEPELVDAVLAANDHLSLMVDAFAQGKEPPVDKKLSQLLQGFIESAATIPSPKPPGKGRLLRPPSKSEALTDSEEEDLKEDDEKSVSIIPIIEADDIQEFMIDAGERLDNLEEQAVLYEKDSSMDVLNSIFRDVHTIKGDASYLQLEKTANYAHLFESILARLRDGKISRSSEICDLIIRGVDGLRGIINLLAKGEMVTKLPAVCADFERFCGEDCPAPVADSIPDDLLQAMPDDMREVFLDQAVQQRKILSSYCQCPIDDKGRKIIHRALGGLKSAAGFVQLTTFTTLLENAANLENGDDEPLVKAVMAICRFIDGLTGENKPLGEILMEDGAVSKDDVQQALSTQKPVGEILIEQGKLSKDDVDNALAQQRPVGKILVDQGKIEPQALDQALKRQQLMAVANVIKPAIAGVGKEIRTMRVDESKIEGFANMIGELLVSRNTFEYMLKELLDGKRPAQECARALRDELHGFSQLVSDMHHGIMDMRMIPVSGIFQKFTRVVRDISRKQHKDIQLIIHGEETEIDKKVADTLAEPLIHLVRNSCDHGIESLNERREAGKPEAGSLILSATHEGSNLVIKITDDGRGIDREKLYDKAVANGMQVTGPAEVSLADLVFMPGLSSKDVATEFSGRGVGMDVVANTIDSLKGSVDIISEQGEGTEIVLSIPMSLGISTMLLVETAGESYALPFDHVIEAIKIKPASLRVAKGKSMFSYRGKVLGVEFLSNLLRNRQDAQVSFHRDEDISVVILQAGNRRLGVIVDHFVRNLEMAIKPLPLSMAAMDTVSGASIMGDGKLILALNPEKLF